MCHCCGKPAFVEGENYVLTEDGCWRWTGSTDLGGYGRLTYRHERYPAHRLSYLLVHGGVPDDHIVHHICENKGCINPDHLEAIEQRDHFNGHRDRSWYEKRAAKPKPDYVDGIRAAHASGRYTFAELGEMFGVAPQTAHRIVRGERWTGKKPQRKTNEPPSHWEEIRTLYATGNYSQTALAEMFGISQPGVSKIVRKDY